MARFAACDWHAGLAALDENGDIARINLWYQFLETRGAADMDQETDAPPHAPPGVPIIPVWACSLPGEAAGWYLTDKAGSTLTGTTTMVQEVSSCTGMSGLSSSI